MPELIIERYLPYDFQGTPAEWVAVIGEIEVHFADRLTGLQLADFDNDQAFRNELRSVLEAVCRRLKQAA